MGFLLTRRACWLATALVLVAAAAPASAGPTGAWVEVPPMLVGRSFTEAVALPDGTVLVPGGNHIHWQGATLPEAEAFDPATATWTPTAPMAAPHAKHTVTALDDGRVLVTGGQGRATGLVHGNPLTVSEVFDPVSGRWTPTGPMVNSGEVPFNHSATVLHDGRVLVAGGSYTNPGATGTLDTVQVFDPASNSWRAAAPMHASRTYHASTRLADGRVLVAGGQNPDGVPRATAEIWDPSTEAWTETSPMVRPHHSETNAAVLLPDGHVLLVGGATVVDGVRVATNATQLFDPAGNVWYDGPALPGPARTDHVVVPLPDGRVLVAGGLSQDPALPTAQPLALDDAYVFHPRRCRWAAAPRMHVARSNAAATPMADGSVLVIGGQHGARDGALLNEARVERFVPSPADRGGDGVACASPPSGVEDHGEFRRRKPHTKLPMPGWRAGDAAPWGVPSPETAHEPPHAEEGAVVGPTGPRPPARGQLPSGG